MAGQTGQSTFNITRELFKDARQFSFVQIMRLLRFAGYSPEKLPAHSPGGKIPGILKIRPVNSLGFPASDVISIEKPAQDEPGIRITASFLGLYGPASPLPTFYSEDLMHEEAVEETAGRDFLDIFNHRLFTLFFHSSMKYRLFFQVCEERNAKIIERLFCLIGLGEPSHRRGMDEAYSLLRYCGLFSQNPRSAMGLETMLADAFPEASFSILQCLPRQVIIPPEMQCSLGKSNHELGIDSLIGERFQDGMGKFRIRVGPVSFGLFQQMLPGNNKNAKVAFLTRLYLPDPLEYEMELILKAGEAVTVSLGCETSSRLGLDTWIFSDSSLGEVNAIFPMQ